MGTFALQVAVLGCVSARVGANVATYRVGRIRRLVETGEAAERPADFDLAEYWRRWSERFERRLYPRTASVRMSPLARRLAVLYLGAVGAKAVANATEPPDPDGWQRVELPVEAGAPAIGELLRFGPGLEVLAPADLRAEIASAAREMAGRYGGG